MNNHARTVLPTMTLGIALAAGLASNASAQMDPFGLPHFYSGVSSALSLDAGDFDNDGDLDIIQSSYPRYDNFGQLISHGSFTLNTNDGMGNFASNTFISNYGTPFGGHGRIKVGDFNNDGNLDFVANNADSNLSGTILVFIGNGDGTFQPAVPYGSTLPAVMALGDMDNDGDIDVVLANGGRVMLNNGDGSFFTNFVGSDVHTGGSIDLGDFNEDGVLDIVTAEAFAYQFHYDHVFLQLGIGDGQGNPGMAENIGIGGLSPSQVSIGDVNNDGHLDIVTLNEESLDVSVVPGNGDGTFGTPVTTRIRSGNEYATQYMAVADFDNDGNLDIAATVTVYQLGTHHSETSILLGNGTGHFVNVQTILNFGAKNYNQPFIAVDYDNDSDIDLINATHKLENGECIADFNNDGMVNTQDFLAYLNDWSAGLIYADLNGDYTIDTQDFLLFLNLWSFGCDM